MYGKKLSKEPYLVKTSTVKLPNHSLVTESMEVNGRKVSRVVKSAYRPIPREIHADAFTIDNYNRNNIAVKPMPKRPLTPEQQISQLNEVMNKQKVKDHE